MWRHARECWGAVKLKSDARLSTQLDFKAAGSVSEMLLRLWNWVRQEESMPHNGVLIVDKNRSGFKYFLQRSDLSYISLTLSSTNFLVMWHLHLPTLAAGGSGSHACWLMTRMWHKWHSRVFLLPWLWSFSKDALPAYIQEMTAFWAVFISQSVLNEMEIWSQWLVGANRDTKKC